MDIGSKIRKVREIKNFTQEYIASSLNMSIRGYGKIESNESNINFNKLEEICKVLEVNPEDLITFDEKQVFNNTFNNYKGNQGDNFVLNKVNDFEKERELYTKLLESKEEQITYLKEELDILKKERA